MFVLNFCSSLRYENLLDVTLGVKLAFTRGVSFTKPVGISAFFFKEHKCWTRPISISMYWNWLKTKFALLWAQSEFTTCVCLTFCGKVTVEKSGFHSRALKELKFDPSAFYDCLVEVVQYCNTLTGLCLVPKVSEDFTFPF